jgi:hypothetical protein
MRDAEQSALGNLKHPRQGFLYSVRAARRFRQRARVTRARRERRNVVSNESHVVNLGLTSADLC